MADHMKNDYLSTETAPIALFVYNRPEHTRQTVEALSANSLAADSDLYIFSDAPKSDTDIEAVEKVREYVHGICGFRSLTVVERDKNLSLAASIVAGVTAVVEKCGKVIVLEDDIVTSPCFLRYMNQGLDVYETNQSVWHIQGYVPPIQAKKTPDLFFTRLMMCWGWATWKRAWRHFDKNPENLIQQFRHEDIVEFTLGNLNDSWQQVLLNSQGTLDTWAVFWAAMIFQHDGLCLSPSRTLVKNIGRDGSGANRGNEKHRQRKFWLPNHFYFPENPPFKESIPALNQLKKFYRRKKRLNYYYLVKHYIKTACLKIIGSPKNRDGTTGPCK